MKTEKTYNIHPDKLHDYTASKREYFKTIDGKKYCVAFKIYPSGFPVTSLAHAFDGAQEEKTVCGISLDADWQHDEWFGGIECKRCIRILGLKS